MDPDRAVEPKAKCLIAIGQGHYGWPDEQPDLVSPGDSFVIAGGQASDGPFFDPPHCVKEVGWEELEAHRARWETKHRGS